MATLISGTKALPSGLTFAVSDHAFMITPRRSSKELVIADH